ncbi:MAG: hypothetical protein WBP12_05405 [Candidatus Saccharimonas sp.]
MTIAQRQQAIGSISMLVNEVAPSINWRSNDSGLIWIAISPNGIDHKVIPLRFYVPGLTAKVSYFVDGDGVFYRGGERGSQNQLGRVVDLHHQSDLVLHGIAKALMDIIAPPASS